MGTRKRSPGEGISSHNQATPPRMIDDRDPRLRREVGFVLASTPDRIGAAGPPHAPRGDTA